MQTKATRNHCTPTSMTVTQKSGYIYICNRNSHLSLVEIKNGRATLEGCGQFLIRLNRNLPYYPSVTLLVPADLKNIFNKNPHVRVCTSFILNYQKVGVYKMDNL